MSVRRRVVQGIGANGFGQVITLLTQIVSVPIFIAAWGLDLYGEWLVVSAIPTYLALSDIGLTATAGNLMAILGEKRDVKQMLSVYQSTWVMVSILSLAILALFWIFTWFIDTSEFLGLARITGTMLNITLLLLFIYVVLSLQTGILQLPFRVTKENPLSVTIVNSIRLLEWFMATIVVVVGWTVAAVACAFVLTRTLGNIYLFWVLRNRKELALRLGIQHANLQVLKKILQPSIASMCFPIGLSLTLQGFIILIGHVVGSSGVALFNIYRTLTRVPIQAVTSINQAVWPEISYAYGADDLKKTYRLVVRMLQLGIALGIAATGVIFAAGENIINIWITQPLEHNSALLIALALTAFIHIFWQPFWVAQVAINKHSFFAIVFLSISALSLFLGWLGLGKFSLQGAGYALLLTECIMAIAAFVTFRRYFRPIPK